MAGEAANIAVRLSADTAQFNRNLAQAKGSVSGLSTEIGTGVKRLAIWATGIISAGAVLTGAVRRAREFRKAMAEVSTLLPASTRDVTALTGAVERLAIAFGNTPVEQARALYQIISAGASDAAQAVRILTAANRLAVGGVTDIETAADGLTSILNAYGVSAGTVTDVSDAMFVAMRAGKTTIDQLSGALGQVAPIASGAGVSLEETLAATAALTKQGLNTSTSINGLRAVIAAIIKPSKEAQEVAELLGLEFNAAGLQAQGLSGFLEQLRIKTGGNTAQLAQLFGGVEALVPAMALLGNGASDFTETLQDMNDKAGATGEAFDRMADEGDLAFDRMEAAAGGWIDRQIEAIGLMDAMVWGANRVSNALTPLTDGQEAWLINERLKEMKQNLEDAIATDRPLTAIRQIEAEIAAAQTRLDALVSANAEANRQVTEAAAASAAEAATAAEAQRVLQEEALAALAAQEEQRAAAAQAAIDAVTAGIEQESLANQLEAFDDALADKEELERRHFDRRRATLEQFLAAGLISEQGFNERLLELQAQHQETIAALEDTGMLNRLARLDEELATEEQRQVAHYEAQLAALQEFTDSEILTQAEAAQRKEEIERQHMDRMASIRRDGLSDLEKFTELSYRDQASTVFGELTSMTAGVARENKKLFAINKAAGIANAVVSAYEGISKTLAAYPYPLNIGLAAAHAATAFAQVAAIKSTSFSSGAASAPSLAGGTPATPVTNVPAGGASGSGGGSGSGGDVSISLQGEVFGRSQVLALIERISEAVGDGARLRVA